MYKEESEFYYRSIEEMRENKSYKQNMEMLKLLEVNKMYGSSLLTDNEVQQLAQLVKTDMYERGLMLEGME